MSGARPWESLPGVTKMASLNNCMAPSKHTLLYVGSPQPAAPLGSYRPPQPPAPQQPQAPRGMGMALPGRPGQGERALTTFAQPVMVQIQQCSICGASPPSSSER